MLNNPTTYNAGDDFGPADFINMVSWAYDPSVATAGQILIGGVLNTVRLVLRRPTTIANLYVYVQAAGAAVTNSGVGLYNSTGATLYASLVNSGGALQTAWQSTGLKTCAITPQNLAPGVYYVGMWATATTTVPTMLRTASGGSTFNAGTTLSGGTGLRFAAANTGLTTAAPSTFTQTGNATGAHWAAMGR